MSDKSPTADTNHRWDIFFLRVTTHCIQAGNPHDNIKADKKPKVNDYAASP